MRYYLLTYYIKNTDDRTMDVFGNIPYKSEELSMTKDQLLKLITTNFIKHPYIRCASAMEKNWQGSHDYQMKFTAKNPFYDENSTPGEFDPKKIGNVITEDFANAAYFTKYEVLHKGFEVNLEHEEKVIRLGSYFYDLKGVLICEASEEEKKKYYSDKYMTYPIVDDDWRVYEGPEIIDGLQHLIVGKKGDTIPLIALKEGLDYNARENDCSYEDQLTSLERCGITISNRKYKHSSEELSDTIVLGIMDEGNNHFRIVCHHEGYYIPTRYFKVGKDDDLYEYDRTDDTETCGIKISTRIVDDVTGLSWFFNKPNLRVLLVSVSEYNFGLGPNEYAPIPKDWFYTVQTLESEINRELEDIHNKYPNDYFKGKRPDIVEEK